MSLRGATGVEDFYVSAQKTLMQCVRCTSGNH
jgi:hypothetical protein